MQQPQLDPVQEKKYVEPILRFFDFVDESPTPRLLSLHRAYRDLAYQLVTTLPSNAERSTALRKLLEGKDAAVRAAL